MCFIQSNKQDICQHGRPRAAPSEGLPEVPPGGRHLASLLAVPVLKALETIKLLNVRGL